MGRGEGEVVGGGSGREEGWIREGSGRDGKVVVGEQTSKQSKEHIVQKKLAVSDGNHTFLQQFRLISPQPRPA